MIQIDQRTRKITCPIGDTGLFIVNLTAATGEPLAENIDGVAIFAVASKGFAPVFSKVVAIVDNTATIRLTNTDTRTLTRGEYRWDIRVVTDPAYQDGRPITDEDSDDVHSLFSATGLPIFEVTGVAVDV